MKKNLLPLPFLALFLAAMALAFGNSFKDKAWIGIATWATSGLTFVAWLALEQKNLTRMVQGKGAKYGASSGLSMALILAIIVGIAMLTTKARFNKSYDATRSGTNTLSDQSLKVIATLKQKQIDAELVAAFQEEQQKTKFKDLLALYTSQGLPIRENWIDPQTEPTKALAEKINQANTAILRHGAQEVRLTTFTEEKLTNALVSLTKEHAKKVYFTKGHGEGDIENTEAGGFSKITEELRNNKFDVAEIALLETTQVPADADLVVVAGPRYDLRPEEIKVLDEFVNRGKPVLLMVDGIVQVPNLNAFLAGYGLRFKDDLLIIRPDDPRAQMLGQNNAIVTDFETMHPLSKDFAAQSSVALLIPTARSIEEILDNPKSMKPTLVAKTSEAIVQINDVRSEKDLKDITSERLSTGKFGVIGVATGRVGGKELAKNDATGKDQMPDAANDMASGAAKELRIVAIGSSQIVSNLGVAQGPANMDMFINATSYLLEDDDFIAIRPKDPAKSTLDLTTPGSQLSLVFISYIYPFVFLGLGSLAWFRRRSA